jgi:PAS domain S-box-containing protein
VQTARSDRFVGVALALALLVLISIVIGVGYLGLNSMDSLQADARALAETRWTNVRLANEAVVYSNRNSRINTQVVVTSDRQEAESLLLQRTENSAKITTLLQRLQGRVSSETERDLLNAIMESRASYVTAYRRATDVLLKQEKAEEARKHLIQVAFPLLLKYHLAWEEYVRFQTDEMDKQLKRSALNYAAARIRTIYWIAFSVLLALGIAVVVVQKLMVEIIRRESAESNLRGLNEELELKVLERTASLDKSNQNLTAEVAERKEIEQAKSRSEQLFRSIAENSADLIAVVDQTGHRIYNNPTYERLLGYTPEELKETVSFQQIHPDDRPVVTRAAQQALETGVGQIVEYRMQRKDGTYVSVESHGSFIRDSRGEIEAFVISARDVSDRRMAMQTEKLSAIGQLAAGVAHELNTPVQYVSDNLTFLSDTWNQVDAAMAFCRTAVHASVASGTGASDAVGASGPPPDWDWLRQEVPKAISQSLEGIRRTSKILGAMRRFSHTGGGERQCVDLNESLDATLTVVQSQIKHLADVQTDYQPDLSRVECYCDEMNQVFLNLIINAAHAIRAAASTSDSRERGKLIIRTRQIEDDVQIEIEDNGTGIPLAARARVFDPFFTTKQVGEGTGQGLTICHEIVTQKHHGRIWFDTEVDRGTTFFIRIPIQFDADKGEPK